ncbi:uncharacterized protein LOC131157798 [Malania oleifera]|uniref:uncharacterized protein LOC131157798 n=1 Tax=Malania oleifera TaxID=397392 RepID=UPI0025ADDCAF|nr:uncharacterized protein LOC131157798 [Malania oleifera]
MMRRLHAQITNTQSWKPEHAIGTLFHSMPSHPCFGRKPKFFALLVLKLGQQDVYQEHPVNFSCTCQSFKTINGFLSDVGVWLVAVTEFLKAWDKLVKFLEVVFGAWINLIQMQIQIQDLNSKRANKHILCYLVRD